MFTGLHSKGSLLLTSQHFLACIPYNCPASQCKAESKGCPLVWIKNSTQMQSYLKWINSGEIPTSKQKKEISTTERKTTLLHPKSHYGQKREHTLHTEPRV